jgi:hypothetical protein
MSPKFGDRPIAIIKQGGTVEAAIDAIDGTIDSVPTTAVFSHYKPNPYREIIKE